MRSRRTPLSASPLAALLGAALVVAPLELAHATPPEDAGGAAEADLAEEEEPPELIEARELFEKGVASFAGADYGGAIDAWIDAYSKVPAVPEYARIKAEIIYNVATAQQKWFDIDKDIQHLRQAKALIKTFIRDIPTIYEEDEATDESNRAKALLYDLDERIEQAEEEERLRQLELEKARAPTGDPELEAQQRRRNRALIFTGVGFTVLGLSGLGVMGAGAVIGQSADDDLAAQESSSELAARQDTLSRGQTGNALFVTGALVGGVLTLTGVPLLVTGVVFEKRRQKRKGPGEQVARPCVSPLLGPGVSGVAVAGRF